MRYDFVSIVINDVLYVYGGEIGSSTERTMSDLWTIHLHDDGAMMQHVGGKKHRSAVSAFSGDKTRPTDAKISFPSPRTNVKLASRGNRLLIIGGRTSDLEAIEEIWEFDPIRYTFALVHEGAVHDNIGNPISFESVACTFYREKQLHVVRALPGFSSATLDVVKFDYDFQASLVTSNSVSGTTFATVCVYMPESDNLNVLFGEKVLKFSFADAAWKTYNEMTAFGEEEFNQITVGFAAWPVNKDTFAVMDSTYEVLHAIQVGENAVQVLSEPFLNEDRSIYTYGPGSSDYNGNGYVSVTAFLRDRVAADVHVILRCCGKGFETVTPSAITASSGSSDESSTAAIAGGVAGGVAVMALGAFLVHRRRRLKIDNTEFVNHDKRGVDTANVPATVAL